jgi:hypothetical protein
MKYRVVLDLPMISRQLMRRHLAYCTIATMMRRNWLRPIWFPIQQLVV